MKNLIRGDTVFYGGLRHTKLGERAHVQNRLHGRIIIGPFARVLPYKLSLDRIQISNIVYSGICLHFIPHGDRFYNWYIKS